MTTDTATAFKVGDWVFAEFELSLIRRMEDGRVQEVTDGACNHSGYDLTDRCMPLTYEMKQIADHFAWVSKEIHAKGSSGLNYPDIHRWLVDHWTKTCALIGRDAELKASYEQLSKFHADILRAVEVESGYGFPLMRRRVG